MSTKHVDIRQHILDTAKPMILGKGFTAVGLNEVLSAAAVPKGSFYHYFKSKEHFGETLLDTYFSDYHAQMDSLLSAEGLNAAQRLMSYWLQWLNSQCGDGQDGKCLAVKLSAEVADISDAMRIALERGTNRIIDSLAICIREGLIDGGDGSLHGPLDSFQTAQTLYELWLGATLLTKLRRDRSALEGAMTATLQLLGLERLDYLDASNRGNC
jgi:TetR/AcrR family transcriptional repressor of nem operon